MKIRVSKKKKKDKGKKLLIVRERMMVTGKRGELEWSH